MHCRVAHALCDVSRLRPESVSTRQRWPSPSWASGCVQICGPRVLQGSLNLWAQSVLLVAYVDVHAVTRLNLALAQGTPRQYLTPYKTVFQ